MWWRCWTWSARRWASRAAGKANATVNRVCACAWYLRRCAMRCMHLAPLLSMSYWEVHAAVIDLCCPMLAPMHSMRRRKMHCTAAHVARGSPLSLYSAGSLICRGFAPETVVSVKPFSAAFRWPSSTTSGAPARRNGLRMGIAIRD